jgi:hypothetical protein
MNMELLKKHLSYDYSTGEFVWLLPTANRVKKGSVAGTTLFNGSVSIRFKGKIYLAHRLAWFYTYGCWPIGVIDHKDGNPSNNKLDNLRDVPHVINCRNQKLYVTNTSGVKGVTLVKGRWAARIVVDGKAICLGTYDNKEDAIKVREQAEETYHFLNRRHL